MGRKKRHNTWRSGFRPKRIHEGIRLSEVSTIQRRVCREHYACTLAELEGCKSTFRAFERKNGGSTADFTSGRVSVRARRNRKESDEPGLFWEYCRDYDFERIKQCNRPEADRAIFRSDFSLAVQSKDGAVHYHKWKEHE